MTGRSVMEALSPGRVLDCVIFPRRVVAGADEKNLVMFGIVVADVAQQGIGRNSRVGSIGCVEVHIAQRRQRQFIDGRGVMRRRPFCLRKIVHGIVPRGEEIDPSGASSVDFQRAQQIRVIGIRPAPGCDGREFGRISVAPAGRRLQPSGIAIGQLVMNCGSGEFRAADRLLDGMHERK